ncbi:MAG: SpoIIE family protein phosphatase [Planctomycetes bacterium]|nr:SpoIIE family protein phosphatase [Planctomycetota bacterium]
MSNPEAVRPVHPMKTIVLLVDDQMIIAAAVHKMLQSQPDWEFHYCNDGTKAVEMALALRPTVILQDLVMPETDGLSLVPEYRKHPELAETPLVVLSSLEVAETKAKAFALGANDYLVKLPDPVEVIARIKHHSDGYKAALERNAAYAALAASEKHLQEEAKRAAEYVRSLLPDPIAKGAATAQWKFVPSESLGGDAFGYHWLDESRMAIYLLDVCGHGVGPALLGVSAMNTIRGGAIPGRDMRDPAAVLEGLNDLYPMAQHNDMFFTLWYGILDVDAATLKWCGGGHPPALVVGPDGALTRLPSQGLMIGAATGIPYDSSEVKLQPNSKIFVYSDGIFEITKPDNTMTSLEDYIAEVGKLHAKPDPLASMVAWGQAAQGTAQFVDDVSLLEIRFNP